MRVLLDEQLPLRLARELTGHDVRSVRQQGWTGVTNGVLLRRAAADGFEVFHRGHPGSAQELAQASAASYPSCACGHLRQPTGASRARYRVIQLLIRPVSPAISLKPKIILS